MKNILSKVFLHHWFRGMVTSVILNYLTMRRFPNFYYCFALRFTTLNKWILAETRRFMPFATPLNASPTLLVGKVGISSMMSVWKKITWKSKRWIFIWVHVMITCLIAKMVHGNLFPFLYFSRYSKTLQDFQEILQESRPRKIKTDVSIRI